MNLGLIQEVGFKILGVYGKITQAYPARRSQNRLYNQRINYRRKLLTAQRTTNVINAARVSAEAAICCS